ncbi:MAG: hypothetical protein Q4C95_00795 [Planctomycetia bacterium]|nr:hypothetical protein [Planctomycetia bacterium]
MTIFNIDWSEFWQTAFQMSWFEVGMLICFGASWPFSIFKVWRTQSCEGKSFVFLGLVMIGYLFGIFHKLFYHLDIVILLYSFLFLIVLTDFGLCLFVKKKKKSKE